MAQKSGENNFYMGRKNLPTPEAVFDYAGHPEWVADIDKCKKSILYFAENFFFIINVDSGRQKIKLYPYQKKLLRSIMKHNWTIVMQSRQSGKSTTLTIYALWLACFFEDQRILIVANKESSAINIFKRIRLAYEQLPNYLKPGTVEWGKTGMSLGNGSSIGITTTSSDAGRSESVNALLLDEFAHVDVNLCQEFWDAVYPIISASKKSKILITSTPKGTGNLFHKIYTEAVEGTNGWHAEKVSWQDVPGRDEEWRQKTIKGMGSMDAFLQEFQVEFLQIGESTLDVATHTEMKAECSEPTLVYDDGHYLLWDEPKQDGLYVAGVDVAEGVKEAASCIQILDISNLQAIKQVASYHSNEITPFNFTTKVLEILEHWGRPPALIERNNCGAQVVDQLKETYHYENLVSYGTKGYNRAGIQAHTNTKYNGVVNMRYWINELRALKINDLQTLNELQTFVRFPNGTWGHASGSKDDRIMSLIWALMILDKDLCEKFFEILEVDGNSRPMKLKSIDYGLKKFINPTSMYASAKGSSDYMPIPILFEGGRSEAVEGIEELEQEGWTLWQP